MLDWKLSFHIFSSFIVTKLLKSSEKAVKSQTVNLKPKQSAYSKLDTNKVPWAVNLLPFNWDKLHWFPWNTIFTLFVSASTGIRCKSQLAFHLVKWGKLPWPNTASWLLLSFQWPKEFRRQRAYPFFQVANWIVKLLLEPLLLPSSDWTCICTVSTSHLSNVVYLKIIATKL